MLKNRELSTYIGYSRVNPELSMLLKIDSFFISMDINPYPLTLLNPKNTQTTDPYPHVTLTPLLCLTPRVRVNPHNPYPI
jgi:hypothetical protein